MSAKAPRASGLSTRRCTAGAADCVELEPSRMPGHWRDHDDARTLRAALGRRIAVLWGRAGDRRRRCSAPGCLRQLGPRPAVRCRPLGNGWRGRPLRRRANEQLGRCGDKLGGGSLRRHGVTSAADLRVSPQVIAGHSRYGMLGREVRAMIGVPRPRRALCTIPFHRRMWAFGGIVKRSNRSTGNGGTVPSGHTGGVCAIG